jgi:hypothetical protein
VQLSYNSITGALNWHQNNPLLKKNLRHNEFLHGEREKIHGNVVAWCELITRTYSPQSAINAFNPCNGGALPPSPPLRHFHAIFVFFSANRIQ